ncbi:MAG: hypothetical protein IIB44_02350 [Candidatus Marinimicrobia bacterium]|nr:hypothetical protein [Candidatus Neomarinimicrobiota bacterium]
MRAIKFKFAKQFIFSILSCLLFWTCGLEQPLPENPYDPLNLNYSAPRTQIISSPSGTVTEKSVTFAWQQKDPFYNSDSLDSETYGKIWYRYRLNADLWSMWSMNTSVAFDFLDDQDYLFEVMSKYPTNIMEDVPYPKKSFTMDAYRSSLVFSPRMTILRSDLGENTFAVSVRAEDVSDIMGVHIIVDYDPDFLKLNAISLFINESDFLLRNGGDIIQFLDHDSLSGELAADLVMVMGSGGGVDGSGDLMELQFEQIAESDTMYISFGAESSIRNSMNEEILEDRGNGVVYVW